MELEDWYGEVGNVTLVGERKEDRRVGCQGLSQFAFPAKGQHEAVVIKDRYEMAVLFKNSSLFLKY